MLTEKEKKYEFENIKYENVVKERDQVIKLVPIIVKNNVDSIRAETKKMIKMDTHKGAIENSMVFIQVQNNETKIKLQKQNFISILS
ncbi:hypothetical protein ACEN2I_17680 [Flavobacterium sp. W22_SRS_FK3]|uniref:hypothetical protein n=1 Tax=Flavobacterium sp. W22_SRS_FK3 TaxID=3240275 RepID=UPI003F91B315